MKLKKGVIKRNRSITIVSVIFLLVAATPASADTMWTLNGVIFTDGGQATGSFNLDTLGNVTAGDIVTTDGTMLASSGFGNEMAGFTYTLTSQDQYFPGTGNLTCPIPTIPVSLFSRGFGA